MKYKVGDRVEDRIHGKGTVVNPNEKGDMVTLVLYDKKTTFKNPWWTITTDLTLIKEAINQ